MREQDGGPTVAFHGATARRLVLFGPFRFDFSDCTLTRDGVELHVPPRALAVLGHLLERPGRVVSKQALLDAVWHDAAVGETSLTEAIGILRQVLGDSAQEPAYIQTLHRRGYRFVAPLRMEAQASPPLAVVAPQQEPARLRASRLPIGAALVAAIALGAAVAGWYSRRGSTAVVTRATITLPPDQSPAPGLNAHPIAALSPDGRRLVYTAGSSGSYRLFSRSIGEFAALPVPGTENGHGAFFSPDGESIGFFAGARLKAMKLPDGRPIDLAAASAGFGGWWHTDGTIVFATGRGPGLMRVPAAGGDAVEVRVNGIGSSTLRYPQMLPDGRTIIATEWRLSVRHSQVVSIDVASGAARVIAPGVFGRWVPTGHVLYLRNGSLMATPLDGGGAHTLMVPEVMTGLTAAGQFTVASNGTLLYVPEAPARRHRTVAAVDTVAARLRALAFEPRAFQNIAVSPDGQRIATTIYEGGASDIWIGDIARGTLSKIPGSESSLDPVWSPDGRSVLFGSTRGGELYLHRAAADASTPPAMIGQGAGLSPTAAAPDGALIVQRLHPQRHMNIHVREPDGRLTDWSTTGETEARARLSPDGRWVAYQSMKSGRWEIYLRPFRGNGEERLVSQSGGYDASWGADGRIVYYLSGTSIMGVPFDKGVLGTPSVLLDDPDVVLLRSSGSALLVLKRISEHVPVTTLNLVVHWLDELRAKDEE